MKSYSHVKLLTQPHRMYIYVELFYVDTVIYLQVLKISAK